MAKIEESKKILAEIGMPTRQQSDLCSYVLLALLKLDEYESWKNSSNEWIRIHDIIIYLREAYGVIYAENSRETIRKQALHHFRNAAFAFVK